MEIFPPRRFSVFWLSMFWCQTHACRRRGHFKMRSNYIWSQESWSETLRFSERTVLQPWRWLQFVLWAELRWRQWDDNSQHSRTNHRLTGERARKERSLSLRALRNWLLMMPPWGPQSLHSGFYQNHSSTHCLLDLVLKGKAANLQDKTGYFSHFKLVLQSQ